MQTHWRRHWLTRNPNPAILTLVLFLTASAPRATSAQTGCAEEYRTVLMWIENGGISPERMWNKSIAACGIAFELTAATEAHLRSLGAGDDWIAVLRRAAFHPPASTQATTGRTEAPVAFSRRALRPVYYGNETRIGTYVGISRLKETGGAVAGHEVLTSEGIVPLRSTPLPASHMMYGLVVDYMSGGLDIEGSFQPDLLMLNAGFSYGPFLPIGATGFRIIAGGTAFLGITRQIIGHVPRAPSDTSYNAIELLNDVYGGDARLGLAYHWRPGAWVYAEWHGRIERAYQRELRVPGEPRITEGIPWSMWSARGSIWRVGVGF